VNDPFREEQQHDAEDSENQGAVPRKKEMRAYACTDRATPIVENLIRAELTS